MHACSFKFFSVMQMASLPGGVFWIRHCDFLFLSCSQEAQQEEGGDGTCLGVAQILLVVVDQQAVPPVQPITRRNLLRPAQATVSIDAQPPRKGAPIACR